MNESLEYDKIDLTRVQIEETSIAVRQVGTGKTLVFIHGFPTHGYTWRKVIPFLSSIYRCVILDLPGLGDSEWNKSTDLNIDAQSRRIVLLLKRLKIESFSLVAHDSGGTIARLISMNDAVEVEKLILINTEIPDHRPPFIELYQKTSRLPFSSFYFRKKLSQERFVRSSMGFKQAYTNRDMFNDKSNLGPYLNPLINSRKRTKGAFKFLRGIDWKIVDDFKDTHKLISSSVLLLWGVNDKTFPIELGKEMVAQFSEDCEFQSIQDASLLPHEEKPQEVANEILKFLATEKTPKNE